MMWKTHFLFALFIGLFLIASFDFNYLIFFPLLLIGSLIPDIDSPYSKYGRKIRPFSNVIELILGHRGAFHSLVFLMLSSGAIYIFLGMDFAFPFFVGYLSHLIADMLTKEGVEILWPLKYRINGFIETNSIIEKVFLIFLALANIYALIYIL